MSAMLLICGCEAGIRPFKQRLMIVSPTGGSIGIAFAVPADTLRKAVPQLKEHGYVTRGWTRRKGAPAGIVTA